MNTVNLLPVNEVLQDTISSITAADLPPDNLYVDGYSRQKLQTYEEIINTMGILSTKAQGLKRTITTLEKLRSFPDQKLYILKDEKANHGSGQAIGLLKIGPKSLYLYDKYNNLTKATPICILDFFVLEGKQRAGYGKKMFDFMLEDMKLNAYELAVDGPSNKMLNFLRKHYGFDEIVKQGNNFAVCQKFFKKYDSIREKTEDCVTEQNRYKWHSKVGAIIHGDSSSSGSRPSSESPISEPDIETSEDIWEPVTMSHATTPQLEPELVFQEPSEAVPMGASKAPERPSTLSFEFSNVVDPETSGVRSDHLLSEHSDSQLTEQGYVDLKFHHKKLW